MSYKNMIDGCFGCADLLFAGHPCDAGRALDLLKKCYQENVTMQELLREVDNFLSSENATQEHISAEIEKVRLKFSGWLDEEVELPKKELKYPRP